MVPTDPERKVACLTYDNADGKTQVEQTFSTNVKIPTAVETRERESDSCRITCLFWLLLDSRQATRGSPTVPDGQEQTAAENNHKLQILPNIMCSPSLSLTVVPWPAVCADAAGVPPARVLAAEVVAALRAAAVLVVLALAPAARHQGVAAVTRRARAHLIGKVEVENS